jgi:hypothetical protein
MKKTEKKLEQKSTRKTTTLAILGILGLFIVGLAASVAMAMPYGWFGKNSTDSTTAAGEDSLAKENRAALRYMFDGNSTMPRYKGLGMGGEINFLEDNDTVQAIKDDDYDAYLDALDDNWKEFKAKITEDKFNEMVQQYKNRSAEREQMQAKMDKIKQAIEDEDYDAWAESIKGTPEEKRLGDVITEDNFETYVKMVEALQNGEYDTASELADELGIEDSHMLQYSHMQGEGMFNQQGSNAEGFPGNGNHFGMGMHR